MKDENISIITSDKNLNPRELEGEQIPIKSVEELMALAQMANRAFNEIGSRIEKVMNIDLAIRVKRLRIVQKRSWREVAGAIHADLLEDGKNLWQPSTNQLAGMQLCEQAGKLLHEKID